MSSVADWIKSVADWVTKLSSAELVWLAIAAVCLYFLVRVTRWIARWPKVSHLVWLKSRPRPLGTPRRKLALRVGRPVGLTGPSAALVEPVPPAPPPAPGASEPAHGTRGWLIERLASERLTPGEAVAFARAAEVSPSSRTRLNLACWYADVDRLSKSLGELQLAMESSNECAGWLADEQLRRVCRAFGEEWGKLESRHTPSLREASENGHPRSRPSRMALLVSLISDLRGG